MGGRKRSGRKGNEEREKKGNTSEGKERRGFDVGK